MSAPASLAPRRVLVVDDEEGIRMVLQRLLARLPAIPAVDAASSAEEALDLLAKERYAVILTDFNMGGKNGVELLATAHERWPETKRLLMTGYADEQVLVEARDRGKAADVVRKPWNSQELLQLIARHIDEVTP